MPNILDATACNCPLADVQYLPYMTVNCLCISSNHCLLSFSCHCEALRGSSVDAVLDKCSLLVAVFPVRTVLYQSAVSVCCVWSDLMSSSCHCETLGARLQMQCSTNVHY